MSRIVRSGFFLIIALASAYGQTTADRSDPFFAGPPFTLNQLRQAAGAVFEARLMTAIQKRGLGFYPDQQALAELEKAGATESILNAVRQANAPPPPVPPEQKTNTLTARCQPRECEISVDGAPKGSTNGGGLTIKDLPLGQVTLGFRKQGYAPQDVIFEIKKGLPTERAVVLEPTPETAQQFGKQLLKQLQTALGGPALATQSASISAKGTAIIFDEKGQRTELTVIARLRPGASYFKMQGAGLDFTVIFNQEERKVSKSFSRVPPGVATEIENDLRLFIDYKLDALMARVSQDKFRLSSPLPPGVKPGGLMLRAESVDDRYQLTINDNLLPASVRFESDSGLGSGLTVLYADYMKSGTVQYPRGLTIKLPDAPQHGVQFRFSYVGLNAHFKDRDFR